LETVQRKTVTNKSSKPTERLHFAQLEAFTFQLPGISCSCVVEVVEFPRGFSKTCAALAGIGGSRLAIMMCFVEIRVQVDRDVFREAIRRDWCCGPKAVFVPAWDAWDGKVRKGIG
jgi:hypothetical protein